MHTPVRGMPSTPHDGMKCSARPHCGYAHLVLGAGEAARIGAVGIIWHLKQSQNPLVRTMRVSRHACAFGDTTVGSDRGSDQKVCNHFRCHKTTTEPRHAAPLPRSSSMSALLPKLGKLGAWRATPRLQEFSQDLKSGC